MNLNRLTISGNLTRDIETRTVGERTVANFAVANNRTWKNRDGVEQNDVLFLDCEAWGRQGEVAAQYLQKGSPVILEGRLKQDHWTDQATGQKRSRIKLSVEVVHLVGPRRAGGDEAGDGGEAQASDHEAEPVARPAPARAAGKPAAPRRSQPAMASSDEPPF